MNSEAFDRLTRRMASASTRREVFKAFASALGGIVFGALLPQSESRAGAVPCCIGGGSNCNDYCSSGQVCVNGTVCCDDPGSPSSCPACGSTYCLPEPLEYCIDGACCNGVRACGSGTNAFCCAPGLKCGGDAAPGQCCYNDNSQCCEPSLACGDPAVCCTSGQSCINGQCCFTVNGQCCEQTQICGNRCCPANSCCTNGVCTVCPSGQTCSNGVCCEQSITGCAGTCCPAGWSCQTDNCGFTTCISPCDENFITGGSCLCKPSSAYPVCCYAPNTFSGSVYSCCPSDDLCFSNGCNTKTAEDMCPTNSGNDAPCCILALAVYGLCNAAGAPACGLSFIADQGLCNSLGCTCTGDPPSSETRRAEEPRAGATTTPTASPGATPRATATPEARTATPTSTAERRTTPSPTPSPRPEPPRNQP